MSHDSEDPSGTAPDDRLLVRPYVTPSRPPYREGTTTGPAWPQYGPESPRAASRVAPTPVAGGTGRHAAGRGGRDGRDGRGIAPAVVVGLTALAVAGAVVFLLGGPDEERSPSRAGQRPDLSVPVLPARSPDASPTPAATGSATPGSPRASAPTGPTASRAATSTPPGSAPAQPSGGAAATLRPGDRGPEVSDLQARLQGQGFTYVSVTGVYDGQTRRGVAQLQSDRGITGDPKGVYGPATRAAFG